MKRIFAVTLFILTMSYASYAQDNLCIYGHAIEIKEYEGSLFRLTASVRTETDDDSMSTSHTAQHVNNQCVNNYLGSTN